ncbi:MAG: glucokinase [bacterium]|nr:glucokinase [bacterium]
MSKVPANNERLIMAADIGGTNCRFASFKVSAGKTAELELKSSYRFLTAAYSNFPNLVEDVLTSWKKDHAQPTPEIIVLAVAGPVNKEGNYCKPPLIPWDIDLRQLNNLPILLLNDFLAQGYAVGSSLASSATHFCGPKTADEKAPLAIIGAGTGLGKALYLPNKQLALASEGGHGNIIIESDADFDVLRFFQQHLARQSITWNDLLSGSGLSILHSFFYKDLLRAEDVATVLNDSPMTLAAFSRFYAMAARNFVLDTLACGGLFIAGGIAAKNPQIVNSPIFAETFTNSFHHSSLLEQIPCRLITNEESGLWGAASYARLKLLT